MAEPGPENSITDVVGIAVGQAEDLGLLTGVTVVLPDRPSVAAVDVRGGGPGTRETDALAAGRLVQRIDALVFSGGSAFGLDAAGGVMDWLRSQGRGFEVAGHHVPIVPAAILFDLGFGGSKQWETPPWFDLGRQAAARAGGPVRMGNAGAGLGATAGALKGGTGTASIRFGDTTVGALAIANPMGSVLMPESRVFWAWWLEQRRELGGQTPPTHPARDLPALGDSTSNTTLAVVATDADLTRSEAERVAVMAQNGIARAIRPVHTPFDGDAVFVLSTGSGARPSDARALARIGEAAADCVARSVMRGVYEAEGLAGVAGYHDIPEGTPAP